jgi:uncharacterized membrane protein YfcA
MQGLAEAAVLAVTAALGGFVYRITGFGAALIFMTTWHLLDGLHFLKLTKSLIAVQQCVTVLECFLSVLLFRTYRDVMNMRFAAFVACCAAAGGAMGTAALMVFSANPWFQRTIGSSMFLALFVQAVATRSPNTTAYPKSGRRQMAVNAFVFVLAGLFGGLLGTPGPPLIVYTLLLNVERTEVIMYNAAHYGGFNGLKAALFIAVSDVQPAMMPLLLAVLLGAIAGVAMGGAANHLVSQSTFVEVLQGLLLCFAAMTSVVQTPLELYARACVILVPLLVTIRAWYREFKREASESSEHERLLDPSWGDEDYDDPSDDPIDARKSQADDDEDATAMTWWPSPKR